MLFRLGRGGGSSHPPTTRELEEPVTPVGRSAPGTPDHSTRTPDFRWEDRGRDHKQVGRSGPNDPVSAESSVPQPRSNPETGSLNQVGS